MGLLRERGWKDVRDFAGGMRAWYDAGLPMDSDEGPDAVRGMFDDAPRPVELKKPAVARDAPAPPKFSPTRQIAALARKPTERLLDLVDRLSFGQLFGFWLAMVGAFGLMYYLLGFATPSLRDNGAPELRDIGLGMSLYFSFMCATSVGFGDVVPLGFARGLALIEAVTAILIFGGVVSKLVSRKQELLTEEIHRITSEDRLGRIQMNLHMVMSELSSLKDDVLATERLEGITMIFASELRAVHDILFRPQHLPSEQVLEALLARVASGLAELSHRVEVINADQRCSGTLIANLRVATSTASEICGDCVPRAHAPRVKAWMDRVQELGQRLQKVCQ